MGRGDNNIAWGWKENIVALGEVEIMMVVRTGCFGKVDKKGAWEKEIAIKDFWKKEIARVLWKMIKQGNVTKRLGKGR